MRPRFRSDRAPLARLDGRLVGLAGADADDLLDGGDRHGRAGGLPRGLRLGRGLPRQRGGGDAEGHEDRCGKGGAAAAVGSGGAHVGRPLS